MTLQVDNLTIEIAARGKVLRPVADVSFAIAPGEVLGLVGESGAGKSMTGGALVGLLEPPAAIVAGQIRLDGERIDVLEGEPLRRLRGGRIGSVFQDPQTSLHPQLAIGRQIEDTIRAHLEVGRRAARSRAIDLMRRVGIARPEARIDDYPHQFSGGMRQRIVIALALAADPQFIVADEPTTALDMSVQAQILSLLQQLVAERNMAMLLISHDLAAIAQLASRVAVMYAGRIVEYGPVMEVLRAPRHPYTAGLLRAAPRLVREKLVPIPGAVPSLAMLPPGCSFSPRCALHIPDCDTAMPQLRAVNTNHDARCILVP